MSTLVRGRYFRALIVQWTWRGIALFTLAVVAATTGIVAWTFNLLLQDAESVRSFGSPWIFFAFGFAAGLPLSAWTAIELWRSSRQAQERLRKRKKKPASHQERLEFARNLESQLREYSRELHDAKVMIQREKETVVSIHGEVRREQAERLVHVLWDELRDLGIERVESGDGGKSWWVRV
jgi:hypothetical protein